MPWRGLLAVATALVALAIGSSTAYGATTRADYVAQVDPICQAAAAPARQAFGAFFAAVKHKKGGANALNHPKVVSHQVRIPAAKLYRRLAGIYGAMNAQIAAVAPAPADATRVSAWLALRGTVATDLGGLAASLKHNHLHVFDQVTLKTMADTAQANNSVRDFGFQFCTPPGTSTIAI
jgi:hypothetical protein